MSLSPHYPCEDFDQQDCDGGPDDFDDVPNHNFQEDNHEDTDNSDTDEASEVEFNKQNQNRNQNQNQNQNQNKNSEPLEIKEQMYQDKLANLKKQLEELKNHSHSEYVRRVKRLDYQYKERLRLNDIYKEYLMDCVERDYNLEKSAALKEFEDKKIELQENLITDFEDKRKLIESERHTMELLGDSMEIKSTVTRKLRRRPNEPIPISAAEKRRKTPSGQLIFLLDDKEIESDLKLIAKLTNNGGISPSSPASYSHNQHSDNYTVVETRVEDNKLLYERRWYYRGQSVLVEGKDGTKFPGTIHAINNDVIWIKKTDNNKFKIHTSQLTRGKISIKRRTS